MKKLLFILLISSAAYSQQQVFNVQQYCIDEKPLAANDCDIKGNEYSFVFLETAKKEVVLFLSDTKLKYEITAAQKEGAYTVYNLKGTSGPATMKINSSKTKIEFLEPEKRISLLVGASTKLK